MSTETAFEYDVFLSYSSANIETVKNLAKRLKADGLKVWFDQWEIEPGDSIPAKIENGLENSRLLLLCMSNEAFGADWPKLESQTFRFKDPLNKNRRFIPLRLDDAEIPGSLGQFLFVDWRKNQREQEYTKLIDICKQQGNCMNLCRMSSQVL